MSLRLVITSDCPRYLPTNSRGRTTKTKMPFAFKRKYMLASLHRLNYLSQFVSVLLYFVQGRQTGSPKYIAVHNAKKGKYIYSC